MISNLKPSFSNRNCLKSKDEKELLLNSIEYESSSWCSFFELMAYIITVPTK